MRVSMFDRQSGAAAVEQGEPDGEPVEPIRPDMELLPPLPA